MESYINATNVFWDAFISPKSALVEEAPSVIHTDAFHLGTELKPPTGWKGQFIDVELPPGTMLPLQEISKKAKVVLLEGSANLTLVAREYLYTFDLDEALGLKEMSLRPKTTFMVSSQQGAKIRIVYQSIVRNVVWEEGVSLPQGL